MTLTKVTIYTDGSCCNAEGGWAATISTMDEVVNISGKSSNTTANKMELRAVIEALRVLRHSSSVTIYSDSQYVVLGIYKRMMKPSMYSRDDIPNQDLWLEFREVSKPHKIQVRWVKGHDGVPGNEHADLLAKAARRLKSFYQP